MKNDENKSDGNDDDDANDDGDAAGDTDHGGDDSDEEHKETKQTSRCTAQAVLSSVPLRSDSIIQFAFDRKSVYPVLSH